MTDEELTITVEETLPPEPSAPADAIPAESPAPGEAPVESPPAPDSSPSMEVISVNELLDRLTSGVDSQDPLPEETQVPEETEPPATGADDSFTLDGPFEVVGMTEALTRLKSIETQIKPRPMLTTSFQNYTVTGGLLLLLLAAFAAACFKLLKGDFSWLR